MTKKITLAGLILAVGAFVFGAILLFGIDTPTVESAAPPRCKEYLADCKDVGGMLDCTVRCDPPRY